MVKFTKGITFIFGDVTLAAGQHILVVENLAAFQANTARVSMWRDNIPALWITVGNASVWKMLWAMRS